MGLKQNIENALLNSLGSDAVGEGNIPELAQSLTDAIIHFLTQQTFTITKMKAILEVEDIKTTAPLMTGFPINTAGSPAAQIAPPGQPVLSPLSINKRGGQGGSLIATGHAYVGRNPVPGNETNEDNTKVKLLEENIIGE